MKIRAIGLCLDSYGRGDLPDNLNAALKAGFRAIEFGAGIGRNGGIMVGGREYPESRWDELADMFSAVPTLTIHGCGPNAGGWACSDPDQAAFAMKVFTNQVRFAAAVGARAIALHDTYGGRMKPGVFLAASRENLKRQAELAERHGVAIGVENPAYGSLELMVAQIESVGSSMVGFTVDTGHMCSYLDVYDLPRGPVGLNSALANTLRALLPKCVDMHVHDVSLERGDHYCPGMGSLDWRAWADNVRAANYRGPMQLEVGTFENEAQLIQTRETLETLLTD